MRSSLPGLFILVTLVAHSSLDAQCVLTEQDKLASGPGAAAGDQAGFAVAASNDVVLVGAWLDDQLASDAGAVHVYRFDGATWPHEQKLVASSGASGDAYGFSVSVDGSVAVVGARLDDQVAASAGAVYVYRHDGTTWLEEAKLTASDGASGDMFGYSVAVDGTVIAVGATRDDDGGSSTGSVYVYRWNGTTWVEEDKLLASTPSTFGFFGWATDVSGTAIAVGAVNANEASVYRHNGTVWNFEQVVTASDATGFDNFGYSLALEGDSLLVGASKLDAVYVFDRVAGTWSEMQKLIASDDPIGTQFFGQSVAMNAGTAVIGSRFDNAGGTQAGAAYVFRDDGSAWSEHSKRVADDAAAMDEFGTSVAASGDSAVVGAPLKNDLGTDSGATYVFATTPLVVDIAPESPTTGTFVSVTTCGGIPGGPALLFAVEVAGSPTFLLLARGSFDPQGAWALGATLASSPGVTASFRTLTLDLNGKVLASNDEQISFQ